jgi:hypothetical protein
MSGGSWSNTLTTSLTLPTGAPPPLARIVEDGTTDTILMYDSTGALIASIAATAGTDSFGNSYPAGISASSGVISQSVVLVYNGTPAAGNLVGSISGAAGADGFGNKYAQGIISYNPTGLNTGVFGALVQGSLQLGQITPAFGPTFTNAGSFLAQINNVAGSTFVRMLSPFNSSVGDTIQGEMWLVAGETGKTTGNSGCPLVLIGSNVNASDIDVFVSGSVVKSTAFDTRAVWQTPTFAANWASTTTINGNTGMYPMQYRFMAENDVWILGGAVASGAGSRVFTLPAAYAPLGSNNLLPCFIFQNSTSTVHSGWAGIVTNGNVNILSSTTGITIANGDQVFLNGRFPLGDVP